MYTHNGIEFDYDLFLNNLTVEQYVNHDRISRNKLLDLGGGVGYSLTTRPMFGCAHDTNAS